MAVTGAGGVLGRHRRRTLPIILARRSGYHLVDPPDNSNAPLRTEQRVAEDLRSRQFVPLSACFVRGGPSFAATHASLPSQAGPRWWRGQESEGERSGRPENPRKIIDE